MAKSSANAAAHPATTDIRARAQSGAGRMPGVAGLDIDVFVRLEAAVWNALRDGDAEADASLLTDDFVGVYPTGFSDRSDHVGQLADGATVSSYAMTDARLRVITADHVLLSYRADFRRPPHDVTETMYVSSLWSQIDGQWLNVFSQDTPASASH